MRLTDLDPRWYGWHGAPESRIGVSLECPVHRGTPAAHRVTVPFKNPISGEPEVRRNLWQRTGETFEALTLQPSVNYQVYDDGSPRDPTCWHGFITNGEVT